MRKTTVKKQAPRRKLIIVSILASIVTVSLFILVCNDSLLLNESSTVDCKAANGNYSTSADGLAVPNEADLACASNVEKQRSSNETKKTVVKVVGISSAAINLFSLGLLLRKEL